MKQQFVVTNTYSFLQDTGKTSPILNRRTFKHVMFLLKYKDSNVFCGHNILTEGVFVTQLFISVGISV
jgi:hypothetical protein